MAIGLGVVPGHAFKRCEELFLPSRAVKLGAEVRFSGFNQNFKTSAFDHTYQIGAHQPSDGPGKLISLTLEARARGIGEFGQLPGLIHAAIAFPKFFARFDIQVELQSRSGNSMVYQAVMPDAERFNALNLATVHFVDVPFYRSQSYSDPYFRAKARKNQIPLATRGEQFVQDRLRAPFLGAIVMPKWLVDKYFAHSRFETALSQSSFFHQNHFLPHQTLNISEEPSQKWQEMTTSFGEVIVRLANSRVVKRDQIISLAAVILRFSRELTPGATSLLARKYRSHLQADQLALLEAELLRIAAEPDFQNVSQPASNAFVLSEAIRILSEVTGESRSKIEDIWLELRP